MRRVTLWSIAVCIALILFLTGLTLTITAPASEGKTLVNAQQAAQAFAPASPHANPLPAGEGSGQQPAPAPTATPTAASEPTPDSGEPSPDAILKSEAVAPGQEPKALSLDDLPSDVTNILVMGSDRRVASDPGRTDVMIFVSVDRVNQVVRMLSLPRDLWVYIPGVGYNRLNTPNVFGNLYRKPGGGIGLIKETYKQNLGLRIDRYVIVDFNGFKTVVDALGGVDVDVPCGLYDASYIQLPPGRHHLNGELALRYARSRYSTSDFSRAARQQQIIRALWEQTPKSEILLKIPQLWSAYRSMVETDLTLPELMSLGVLAARLQPGDIKSKVLTYPNVSAFTTSEGAQVLNLNQGGYRKLIADLFGGTGVQVGAKATAELDDDVHGPKVVVLNGTTRKNLETLAATSMRDETGIAAATTGPAFTTDYPKTLVLDYGAAKDDLDRLTKFFSTQAIKLPHPDSQDAPDAVVVVGADYKSCRGR